MVDGQITNSTQIVLKCVDPRIGPNQSTGRICDVAIALSLNSEGNIAKETVHIKKLVKISQSVNVGLVSLVYVSITSLKSSNS